MKPRRRTNKANGVTEGENGGIRADICKSRVGVKLGDLIWVKLKPSSWWPAQVVDADTVSEVVKPSERSVGEVLVRVYGSYLYLYVDPLESRAEFDMVLKLYNGNYEKILNESLNKDLPRSGKSKRAVSEATQTVGEVGPEEDNKKQAKQDDVLSTARICNNVHEQNGRKLCSGSNNKSRKKNTAVVEKDISLKKRVSPRRLLACNKLETAFLNGNQASEVDSAKVVGKSSPTKQKLHFQTIDNETTHLVPENTGKNDNNISIPHKEVVPINVHPDASARSKRIMQSLGLIAPLGSPFSFKIRHS